MLRILRPPPAGESAATSAYLPVEALSLFSQVLDKIQQQPQLHRYRLNSDSAYDGSPKALLLAAHVFSSIFKCQELAPGRSIVYPHMPDLQIPASILTSNAYQFEVALFHWLRLLCGRRPSNVHVDHAWIQCIAYLQLAVNENCIKQLDPVILRGLVKIIAEESPSSDFKAELLSTVAFSALNLLSTWHQEGSTSFSEENQRHVFLSLEMSAFELMSELELSQLITELLDCEPRLQNASDVLSQVSLPHNGDFISLTKDLLDALVPECCRFVSSCTVPEESRDCLPLSNLKLSLGGGTANLPGLRVWMLLTSKVSELITSHKRIMELPKTGSEEAEDGEVLDQRPSTDLTTMYTLCLAPLFLAGSSTNSISVLPAEEEGKMISTLFTLFRSFHAEACLLISVPTNSWIDQFGTMISELVQSSLPDPTKKLNFNILTSFLEFMAKTAEAVDEDAGGRFSPSRWLARRDHPLGQMTGLVDAISKCLAFLPLQRTETPLNSLADGQSGSPKVHVKASDRSPLALFQRKSPSVLSSNQLLQLVVTFQPSSTDSVALLQALGVIVQRHVYTLEALLCLVDRVSSALTNFAAKFSTMPTVPETASIIAAFEAFTILFWQQMQIYLRKPVSTISLTDLPVNGVPALKLSVSQAHRLARFFDSAIVMASLRPKSAVTGSRLGGRKKSHDRKLPIATIPTH
ncbi:unnamed protein product [Schistocephalus solidus]|uniref:RING-type E3 ubiquitin transferase listerin n=1 Tax=Schistocephalus solidus TaxID=70667 RepID=A0A183TFJ2_SCHSO|nr:unnamed protein product [Schistocephalus solidus]